MLDNKYFRAIVGVFFLYFSTTLFCVSANTLKGVRVWPSPDSTRVVMDLSSEAQYSYFSLIKPDRLVVDLKNTSVKTKLPIVVEKSSILSKIRKSAPPAQGTTRLVFELKSTVKVKIFKLEPTPGGQYGHRLVFDIPNSSSGKKKSEAKDSKSVSVVKNNSNTIIGTGEVVIAIDAGHGGEDPGSIGPTKKYEKRVNLTIAKKIAANINRIPGMKAVLTRTGDYFVNLNNRSEIARKNRSHLLLSIHADSFRSPQPRGGSVFVLNTRRANTEIGRWVEQHEKQSELLGGAGDVLSKNINDKNISQTLLDLQFSHSQKEGYKLATNVLAEMGKVTKLHKKKPVHASLAVLKSPDIPSILIETGFISNPTEEKLLFQKQHQDNIARAITKAIVQYIDDNPPQGTLLAAKKSRSTHKVKSGESLSVIAQQYGVTVAQLKSQNKLKSSTLRVGQVLTIPGYDATSLGSASQVQQTIIYKVQSGDYLGKIANKYNVSTSSIRSLNNLKSDSLAVGQKLKINTTASVKKYTVKEGDFLGKVASLFGTSVSSIKKQNNLRSDTLSVGQVLIIPVD